MKESGMETKEVEEGCKYGKKDLFIRGTGKIILHMGMVD
jgi:formylmethanofuran dehydrogenase subunit E